MVLIDVVDLLPDLLLFSIEKGSHRLFQGIGREPVIGIDHTHVGCCRMLKSQVAGYGLTAVLWRLKNDEARVLGSLMTKDVKCVIGGTVVNTDNLYGRKRLTEKRIQALRQR